MPVDAAWQSALSDAGKDAERSWGYTGAEGPAHWGTLAPTFRACGEGLAQSPVALRSAGAVDPGCEPLRFRYRSSSLFTKNDGRALRVGYDRGSYLVIEGLSYELVELRFHVPGEHAIDGRRGDAELQLLHGNNRGDLAIVAVPIVAGRRINQTFNRILEQASETAEKTRYSRNIGINAQFLMPGRKDYFRYDGSLTRPPCTEGVHWYVFGTPLEVRAEDLSRLAGIAGPNARPVQPLNGREVGKSCLP
jgi:carbonic anhydrase